MSEILEAGDDGELIDESTIDVTVNDGIRPPADIVAFCENASGVKELRTGRYVSSGRVWFKIMLSISFSTHRLPDGYRVTHARALDNGQLEITLRQ